MFGFAAKKILDNLYIIIKYPEENFFTIIKVVYKTNTLYELCIK